MLSDSHTHLDQFSDFEVDAMVERARLAEVGLIVAVGSTLDSSRKAIGLAEKYDIVYAGVGYHPMDLAAPFTEADYASLRQLALSSPKVLCISETGLDFLPTSPDPSWQEHAFREHIRLAKELGKPLDFHARESYDVILELMREEKATRPERSGTTSRETTERPRKPWIWAFTFPWQNHCCSSQISSGSRGASRWTA